MTNLEKKNDSSLLEHAAEIVEAISSENTRIAYQSDIRQFRAWGAGKGVEVLPSNPDLIGVYIVYLSAIGRKPSTIQRALTAINQWHLSQGYDSPITERVKRLRKGVNRLHGTSQRKVKAITWPILDRLLNYVPNSAIGIRDRALLLVGFAGAFRRSELVSINTDDISFEAEGMVIVQGRTKTNQEGRARKIAIPFIDIEGRCPVKAVRALIDYNQLSTGPLFYNLGTSGRLNKKLILGNRLKPAAVASIVKKYIKLAGYDQREFSAHSLRAGFATSAAQAGLRSGEIMGHTGHKTYSVLMGYIRDGRLFQGHPLTAIVNASTASDSNSRSQ